MNTVGPTDAPWETPDPLTCIRHLKSLVGHGLSIEHDSTGDLGTLIQSESEKKWTDQHMEYLETEHVEHKTNPQYQRTMVSFWKCTDNWRYRTELRPGLLPVDQDAKPSRMVGKENLAFSRRVAFGRKESRVFPSDP